MYVIPPKKVTASWLEKNNFPLQPLYVVWKVTEDGKKPPFIPKSTSKGKLLTGQKAISLAHKHKGGIGIVIDERSSVIGIDVDKATLDEPRIKKLLQLKKTYIEESPSGQENGSFHLFYTVPQEEKLLLRPKTKVQTLIGQIELFVSSGNYLTLTGQTVNRQPVQEISALDLLKIFPEAQAEESKTITDTFGSLDLAVQRAEALSALRTVPFKRWVQNVPVTENHVMVKYVCKLKGWSHYDYWLYGLMSLYTVGIAAGRLSNAYAAAAAWSQKDPVKWDQAAFDSTWESLSTEGISLKTYVWYYKNTIPQWEAYAKRSSAPAPTPIAENFKIWASIIGAKVLTDPVSQAQIIIGDGLPPFNISLLEDNKSELAILRSLAQFKFAGLEKDNVVKTVYNSLMTEPSFIHSSGQSFIGKWALSKPWDGKDRIQWLIDKVFKFDTESEQLKLLYASMIRKWFWAITKTFDPSTVSNKHLHDGQEGLLILASSLGRVGKTDFGRYLVPQEAPSLYVVKSPDKVKGFDNDRDFIETIHNKLIVCLDEVNKVLTQHSVETLKEFVTASTMWYRKAWGVGQEKVQRTFGVYATTNHESLILPRDGGARRFWWIQIRSINIGLMAKKLDPQQLWAQAHYEMVEAAKKNPYGFPPWVLSEEESALQMQQLGVFRARNNLEEWLYDIFITDREIILRYLKNKNPDIPILRPKALRDAMYLLGIPTKFLDNVRAFNQTLANFLVDVMPAEFKVKQKVFQHGIWKSGARGEKHWILPPVSEEYFEKD